MNKCVPVLYTDAWILKPSSCRTHFVSWDWDEQCNWKINVS